MWGNYDLLMKAEFLFFWIPTFIVWSLAGRGLTHLKQIARSFLDAPELAPAERARASQGAAILYCDECVLTDRVMSCAAQSPPLKCTVESRGGNLRTRSKWTAASPLKHCVL